MANDAHCMNAQAGLAIGAWKAFALLICETCLEGVLLLLAQPMPNLLLLFYCHESPIPVASVIDQWLSGIKFVNVGRQL